MSHKELAELFDQHQANIVQQWFDNQQDSAAFQQRFSDKELHNQSQQFLKLFIQALKRETSAELERKGWADVKEFLNDFSRSLVNSGFSPSETATFIFSLKKPLFALCANESSEQNNLSDMLWQLTLVIDELGLYTTECYLNGREEIIKRQQEEMLELSTPVVRLWDDVLALPLIGTLDSVRTQVVMETLLQEIVKERSRIAIIDITGVPTVDTLVAQHLLKTVAAARLMGAECIISGIRPQIAQTIVHLGVDLGAVTTKASLKDAFNAALQKLNQKTAVAESVS